MGWVTSLAAPATGEKEIKKLRGAGFASRFRLAKPSELPGNVAPGDYRFFVFAHSFYLFAVVVHVLFIPFFALLGVCSLALLNIVSVAVYIVALRANSKGHLELGFLLAVLEILVRVMLCTFILGNTVFSHVPMLLGMVVALATFRHRWVRPVLGALIATVYALVNYHSQRYAPAVTLGPRALMAFNLLVGSGGIVAASCMGYYYASATARAEAALRRRTADLEVRNQELNAFSHTVAHDLKGPLTEISAYSELLAARGPRMPISEQQAHLRTIVETAHKMARIVDEILLLASVGRAEVQSEPLDMAAIVADAQRRLSRLIETHQAEILVPAAWPPACGHGPWVEEVWVNYLSNGILYGGRPPRLELGATVQDDSTVRFWVRDNGPGLSPEEQARLFTPFTRLNAGLTAGHGLGLSIVRRIVERMGGQVAVESEPGRGSTFSFTLSQGGSARPNPQFQGSPLPAPREEGQGRWVRLEAPNQGRSS